ncbi:hypothetical protein SY88_22670 [Clostridiales bacterium PH28_bin88]|nr:hypothetical protein SY88_22670 [Clostridiales bacterium PH28_bin88]
MTMVPLLCGILLLVLLPASSFSAVLTLVEQEWGISHAQSGAILSAFQGGYIASVLLALSVTDRINTRYVVLVGATLSFAGSVLLPLLASDTLTGMVFRGIAGAGLGGVYMPGLRLISEAYGSERRGRIVGFYVACFVLGNALSFAATGALAAAYGWKTGYMVVSLASSTAILLAVYLLWRGRVMPVPAVKPREVVIERGEQAGMGGRVAKQASRPAPGRLVPVDLPTLLMILAYVAHMWEMYGMRSWMAPFLNSVLAASETGSGNAVFWAAQLTSISVFLGALSTGLAGWLSDHFGRTATAAGIMVLSALCSLVFGWLVGASFFLILLVGIVYSLTVNADSPIFSTGVTELAPPGYLGRVMAVQSFLGFGAATASPAFFGWILDYFGEPLGWGVGFTLLGLGALVGPVVLMVLRTHPASARLCAGRK